MGKEGDAVRHLKILIFGNVWRQWTLCRDITLYVWPCLSEQEWAGSWLWNSILSCCGFRKEKAPISPALSLPALSMFYTGTYGNLQRAPRIITQKHKFFGAQPPLWSNSHICTWLLEKTQLWLYRLLLAKWYLYFLICCLGFVIAFLPRSKHLLISCLQSSSTVIWEPKKIKSVTVSTFPPAICHKEIIFIIQ